MDSNVESEEIVYECYCMDEEGVPLRSPCEYVCMYSECVCLEGVCEGTPPGGQELQHHPHRLPASQDYCKSTAITYSDESDVNEQPLPEVVDPQKK